MLTAAQPPARVVLLALYSDKYPAIGESHGLSVVAGSVQLAMRSNEVTMRVLDMVTWGEESSARAVSAIEQIDANVLAVGLPYGTFSVLQREYAALRAAMHGPRPLIVFGGPVATYMSERLISEIEPSAFVIKGEADEALPHLIQCWLMGEIPERTPNLSYRNSTTGQLKHTPRKLVNLAASASPYREHTTEIRSAGGQIFAESSRGCSWAACTFCLRGLTDVLGRGHEYRRKPVGLVARDLLDLKLRGVEDVTFADEDFLGSSLDAAEQFVSELEAWREDFPKLDASLTVHSVFSRHDTPEESLRRQGVLERLAGLGLQKVFLGIESCSSSQLKRYAKGHTRQEALAATRRLQKLGIRVEIGVILFDPLCELEEIEDSLRFMRHHELVGLASGISSELRLQVSSHYLSLLQNYERRHNLQLHSTKIDPDTLSYSYNFSEPIVQRLFVAVNEWNRLIHPLYYPAKSLSRFGGSGAIGDAASPLRHALQEFRNETCDSILKSIASTSSPGGLEESLNASMPVAARNLAASVIECLSSLGHSGNTHPVVTQAIEAAVTFG